MADVCINENLYTAYGYVDEAEELDYGAEEVVPMMYNYQKRDITEEFGIVENTDRVVEEQPVDVAEPMLEDEAYDIREPEYGMRFLMKQIKENLMLKNMICLKRLRLYQKLL